MSLFWIFGQMQENQNLADVPKEHHTWGSLANLAASSTPRICWVPSTVDYAAPFVSSAFELVGGKRVKLDGIWTRWMGADIEFYVSDGPQGPHELEALIDKFLRALREVVKVTGNIKMGRGRWADRKKLSEGTIGIVQPIEFAVPVFRQDPAQIATETNVTLVVDPPGS